MPQCFAQLSDPHLSSLVGVQPRDLLSKRALSYLSWRGKRQFEHRMEVLDALQRDLEHAPLVQLLVTGDLTHIGLPSEFRQARDWLQRLGDPGHVAVVPGNHDASVVSPWEDTFALWRDYMASDPGRERAGEQDLFPSVRVRGNIAFIGMSTACPTLPLLATGTLGEAQLRRLPELLQRAAQEGLCRVVYLHHCPVSGQEKWRKRLTDAPQLQKLLEEHGAELVLHGHGHRAHYHELHTRQGILPVIAVPSASALGLYGADTAQYNRYDVQRSESGWRVQIDMRRYDACSGRFTDGECRSVHLERR